MQRILLVGNVLLALVLLFRVFSASTPVAAMERTEFAARHVVVVPAHGSEGAAEAVVVKFPAALAAPAAGDDDLGLRLDPPVPLRIGRRAPDEVVLTPAGPLAASRRWRLVCTRDVPLQGGWLPAGTIVPFTTPPVTLRHVILVESGPEGSAVAPAAEPAPALQLVFDQKVAADAAAKHVRVVDPEAPDVPLSAAVELPPDEGASTTVVVRLGGDQRLPDVLDVVVGPELVAAGGDVPVGQTLMQRVRWRTPLHLQGLEPGDGGVLLQFSHELPLPAAGQIRVQPEMPFQVRRSSRGLVLLGDFPAGGVVTVDLPAGFPGLGRHRLPGAASRSLLLPDKAAALALAQGGHVLCASALPRLAVEGTNVQRPHVRLRRVYPNNLVRALQCGDNDAFAPATEAAIPAVAARNETWRQEVDLASLAGGPLRGLYRVEVWDAAGWSRSAERWLQVTDLGVTWRSGLGSAAVHVRDLVRGGPVADAEVTVLTPTNQVLASGRTDARGLLLADWPQAGADRVPYLVLAQRGDDVAFASRASEAVELADAGLAGRPYAGERPEAWVWPDRGIVRPGETLGVALLVRDAQGRPAPGTEVALRFVGPNGRVVRTLPVVASASGLASGELALEPDAPMGTWRAEVVTAADGEALGRAPFLVEAFVPDRLEVEVLAVSPLRFGAPGEVKVRGRWLDGAPAVGRRVTLRVRLLAHAAAFASAPGFGFAAAGDEAPPGELPAVVGTLDANGEAGLSFVLPPDAAQQTLLAHLAVELQDPSGRAVRGARQAPVLRPDFHLGLRQVPGGCELRAVDAEGAPVAGALPATVRLERRTWRWLYEQNQRGTWRWRTVREAVPLGEWNVVLLDGAAALPVPAAAGDCTLVATAGSRVVERDVGPASARPDRLRVRGPAAPVLAGQPATLVVTAPVAGRALVTVESDRVHAAHEYELQRGDNPIEVPVPAGLVLPNVHAVVTLTRPVPQSGPGLGPAWLVGGAPIRLLRPDLELPLAFTAPPQMRPDHEWVGTIDAPGATSAFVALVDEGVLRVTGHAPPQPLAFFLASRALGTDGADNGSALLQSMGFAPGTKTGGDSGDEDLDGLLAGAVDSRIRPFARSTPVALDAAGRGVVRLPVGGYEGRLRAVVVAAGPRGLAAARADTVVQAPLSVQVATPRMAAPGDRFVLPVTLRHALPAGDVVVQVAAEGALALAGEGRRVVAMATGAETTWEVPVVAGTPAPGESLARLRVVAEVPGERREVAAEFTVRAPAVPAHEVVGVDLAAGGEVVVAAGWQQVAGEVRLDLRPDQMLAPVLSKLLGYPHGCAEQTMAKGMALLACRTMLPRLLGDSDPRVATADRLVQTAVDRLLGMQAWRGGFGWWPGADIEAPFVTAWVTDFLVAANEQGLVVPPDALALALDRCAELLRDGGRDTRLRCHLVDVLARAGRPVQPWLDWLCTVPLTADDRCLLASAWGRLGDDRRAQQLLHADDETPVLPDSSDLASPLRSQALYLRAAATLAAPPGDLPARAQALQQALRRQPTTTQEQWQGLRALADWYRRQPQPTGEVAATLAVDGTEHRLAATGLTLPLRAGSTLRFAPGGRGFALVELRGLRLADEVPRQGKLLVERTLVDVETGLPAERCRRGRIYEVRIVVASPEPIRHLAVVDLLPGGLEPEPEPVGGPDRRGERWLEPDLRQAGDDRVLLFCRHVPAAGTLRYRVRATLPGAWQVPGVRAEAMYAPDSPFVGAPGRPLVVDP